MSENEDYQAFQAVTSNKNGDNSGNAKFLKEWETARNVLKDFDAHLHDLRKSGFSFLTALLAAESLIFPVRLAESSIEVLPDEPKLAVLLVDLILIVALLLLDRNYQTIQGAAATRARVLERALDLELTEIITQKYERGNVQYYVTGVYLAFVAGVSILGVFVLYPNYLYIKILLIAVIAAIIAESLVFILYVKVHYPHGKTDWTLDRLQCNSGDEVGITVTNLGRKKIEFKQGDVMWMIVKEDDESIVEIKEAARDRYIGPEDSYTWLWKAKGVNEGVYSVHRAIHIEKGHPDDGSFEFEPLLRKLRIKVKPPTH